MIPPRVSRGRATTREEEEEEDEEESFWRPSPQEVAPIPQVTAEEEKVENSSEDGRAADSREHPTPAPRQLEGMLVELAARSRSHIKANNTPSARQ